MSEERLYTVVKMEDSDGFLVTFSGLDEERGILSDGEFIVAPGEKFLDRIEFADVKEGQYDARGNYLGPVWAE